MSEILKPCPFCGNEAEMIVQWSEEARCDGYAVRCRSCFTRSGLYTSEQRAAEKWNHRFSPVNEPLTLEQLRKMGGKPVYIILLDTDDKFWLIRERMCWIDTYSPEPMSMFHCNWYKWSDYGKTWLAYAHEPGKDGEKE